MRRHLSALVGPLLAALSLCTVANAVVLPSGSSADVAERLFLVIDSTTLPTVPIDLKPSTSMASTTTSSGGNAVLPDVTIDVHQRNTDTISSESFPATSRLVTSNERDSGTITSNFTHEDHELHGNYCKYHRSHHGFNRYWLILAPEAKDEDIPDWCGGLWDNLNRWASCDAVSCPYCGRMKDEHAGKPGLQWDFKITDTCHSGYLNSVWWEATKGKLGEMKCSKDVGGKIA